MVEAPGSGRRALARLLRTRSGRAALTPGRSLDGLTQRWFANHSALGLVLDDYARQAGADPRHAPAVLTAHPYIEHAFGAWCIPGGMHTLGTALFERAVSRGAEVRFDAPVARIQTASAGPASARVTGVVLDDGTELAADLVIAAVDVAVLARLTGATEQRLAYSQSVTTLCLALDDAPAAEMPHETVLLDENGPAVRIHVARERPSAWTVHADGDHEPEALLDAIARRGFDVRDRVRARHLITAADREAATGVPGGAVYGPAPRDLRTTLLRSPVAQPTRGLYHVGASARPGPGLSFAALSGWQATELIDPSA
jgi:phytoene dehydrogenase-like protein